MHWAYRRVTEDKRGKSTDLKLQHVADSVINASELQLNTEILVCDLETDLLLLQPQERLRNNTVYIRE